VPNNPRVRPKITPTNSVESQVAPMMPEDPNNSKYWQILVTDLMQRIPPVPPFNPPKDDKLADG